jgi:retron-type reverse transcriptase
MAKPMLPLLDLYPRLTSFANLYAAARRAQRAKRYRSAVLTFNARLEAELFALQEELQTFSYRPRPFVRFEIFEPKRRVISAAAYRDRVVHHALCAVIVPPLERGFLPTSYANRTGYGSHRALRQFDRCCKAFPWVFQADLRLYFPSIDHHHLLNQLHGLIACPGTLWLLETILAHGAEARPTLDPFPGDTLLTPLERPHGLPIGNLTSQFLANLHLNDFDHEIASMTGVASYLRYVDDFALFAHDRPSLERARARIEAELEALRLRLHPIKSQIRRCHVGTSFVGFHVLSDRIRVRNHTLRRGRRRLRAVAAAVAAGRLAPEQARQRLISWNAHLRHGNTWRLRRQAFAPLPFANDLL